METSNFEKIVSEITNKKNVRVVRLINQDAKKWYEKNFEPCTTIEENTIYGIVLYDNVIDFEVKVGKFENLLKTFTTHYIKYLCTTYTVDKDGNMVKHDKESAKNMLHEVSRRYGYLCAYSTNYGIGVWNLFVKEDTKELVKSELRKLLTEANISFKNEYSDAFWAYRFKFAGNYLDHNLILKKLEENCTNGIVL